MALYAALLYYDTDRYWTDESEAEHLAGYDDFEQAAAAAGVSRGGQALQPPSTAATIAVAGHRDGELTVTDGPFAETKEVLGGFLSPRGPRHRRGVPLGGTDPRGVAGKGRGPACSPLRVHAPSTA